MTCFFSKKTLVLLLAFLLLLTCLCSCGGTTDPSGKDPHSGDPAALSDDEYFSDEHFVPVLRFSAASDVHIAEGNWSPLEEKRLAELFDFTYSLAENSATPYKNFDLATFAGDISDNGALSPMKKAKTIMDRSVREGTQLLLTLGNHEFHYMGENLDPEEVVARFKEAYGREVSDHVVVNGFHFIALSMDEDTYPFFSDETLAWLDGELQKAVQDNPTYPVFVFDHLNVRDTVYGSETWGFDTLTPIFSKYPQVISFSGHSHYPLNDPRSIWQGGFTAFNTGTLSFSEMGIVGVADSGVYPFDHFGRYSTAMYGSDHERDAAWYYVVEADAAGAVRVIGYDLDAKKEIVRYGIRTPADPSSFKYNTEERIRNSLPPVFPEGAEVVFSAVRSNSFSASFPTAFSEDNVQNYRVELLQDGEVVKTQHLLSCTFYVDPPENFDVRFAQLTKGATYTVRVTAVNSFAKESQPLTGEIILK